MCFLDVADGVRGELILEPKESFFINMRGDSFVTHEQVPGWSSYNHTEKEVLLLAPNSKIKSLTLHTEKQVQYRDNQYPPPGKENFEYSRDSHSFLLQKLAYNCDEYFKFEVYKNETF